MGCALTDMTLSPRNGNRRESPGDLRVDATPKSDRDVLGNAARNDIGREACHEIRSGAEPLAPASTESGVRRQTEARDIGKRLRMTATMHQMSAAECGPTLWQRTP
jgi:hypothetical protein